jgi:DNA transposition AAA+ family ATPase
MSEISILKTDLQLSGQDGQPYDKLLHERFEAWRAKSGYSLKEIENKLSRSQAAISRYLNFRYAGDLPGIEADIRSLLRREQSYRPAPESDAFCATSQVVVIWEVAEFCRKKLKMGAAVGPAGTSKTKTALELKRKYPATILITVDLTQRSMGAILRALSRELSLSWAGYSRDTIFEKIAASLLGRQKFIIVDEAHLLSWEAWEIMRSLWDRAPCGVLFLGMPRTLSHMRSGSRGFLWDQIYSRLTITRTVGDLTKSDVKLVADSIQPGLSKACFSFLYEKALGPGRLRTMCNLLRRAVEIAKAEDIYVSLQLLREIDET